MNAPHAEDPIVKKMLIESNLIESVSSEIGLQDAQAAWNMASAVTFGIAPGVAKPEYSVQLVLDIHKGLMHRLNERIAGNIRTVNIMVGGRLCPKPKRVPIMLFQWITTVNGYLRGKYETDSPPAHITKRLHIDFEKIHPFEDGNGRVGRILYNLHRLDLGLDVHIIEAARSWDYYKWFE